MLIWGKEKIWNKASVEEIKLKNGLFKYQDLFVSGFPYY